MANLYTKRRGSKRNVCVVSVEGDGVAHFEAVKV
jgi:hypothetical protein